MPTRTEHGRARPQPPRRKDLGPYSAPDPEAQPRTANGRFAAGNTAAANRGLRAIVRKQLGSDATSAEVESVYRDTLAMFNACLAELPAKDSPAVQDLVARWARWSVLSARYATQAAAVGLYTAEGQKLLETSIKLDARAERLQVTARDEAERTHRARPGTQQNSLLAAIEAAGNPTQDTR